MSVDVDRTRKEESEGVGGAEALLCLRKCQNDIVSLRHKCDRQIDEVEKRYAKSVRPYLEKRNCYIQNIPRFWSRSILNHPLLSTVFEPGESEVLNYLSNLQVDEESERPDYFKIHFSFRRNPYFENRTLTKEFKEYGSTNSVVRWKKGQEFPKVAKHELWEDDDLGLEYKGFFRWFLDASEHYCDPIADIIKTCIWYNPMEFYDMKMGESVEECRGGTNRRAEGSVAGSESTSEPRRVVKGKEKPARKLRRRSARSED